MKTRHITSFLNFSRFVLPLLAACALTWVVTSCKHSDLWDDMPGPIAEFINHYYPFSELDSFTKGSTTYHVRIDDGPGLTFGSDYAWIAVDGYGLPLPQVMLFDQLPPALYNYLQETERLNGVFSMERDNVDYTVTLLDGTLRYVIATGEMKLTPTPS